jgi:MFS family permease
MQSKGFAIAEWRTNWQVVFASSVGVSAIALHVTSLGALIEPIQVDTGWSRQNIVVGFVLTSIVALFVQPLGGLLVDRFGPRPVAVPGLLLYGIGLGFLAIRGLGYTGWLTGWLLLAVAFCLLAPVWVTAVTKRFDAARGMAIALAVLGGTVSAAVTPIVATMLENEFGWRATYLLLAAYPVLVALPIAALCYERPRLAFSTSPQTITTQRTDRSRVNWDALRAMIRSRHFWLLSVGGLLLVSATAGIGVHGVPMLVGLGLTRESAAAVVAAQGIGAFVGRLGAGFLLDRFNAVLVTLVFVAVGLLGLLVILSGADSIFILTCTLFVIGVSLGSELDCLGYLASKYFPLKYFGFAYAAMSALFALGALSPMIGGALYDRYQTYWQFIAMLSTFFAVALLLFAALGRYPHVVEGVDEGAIEATTNSSVGQRDV